MAAIKFVQDDLGGYYLIQCSRGRGKSPTSERFRMPPGAQWSQRTWERNARARAAETEAQIRAGTYMSPKEKKARAAEEERLQQARPTFQQFCESTFLPQKKLDVTTNSYIKAQRFLEIHVFPRIGEKAIADITTSDLQNLISNIWDELAPTTAKTEFGCVRQVFDAAARLNVITQNPCQFVVLPRRSKDAIAESELKRQGKALSVAETKSLLAAAADAGTYWCAFFTLAVDTGARVGELCALRWENIDITTGAVSIQNQQRYEETGSYSITYTKTLKSRRTVDIGPDSIAALKALRTEQEQAGYSGEWVFPGRKGTDPIRNSSVRQRLESICKLNGLRKITPHNLRHSMISRSLSAGASVEAVRARAGHSSVATTLNCYTHALDGDIRRAGEAARSLLNTEENPP